MSCKELQYRALAWAGVSTEKSAIETFTGIAIGLNGACPSSHTANMVNDAIYKQKAFSDNISEIPEHLRKNKPELVEKIEVTGVNQPIPSFLRK